MPPASPKTSSLPDTGDVAEVVSAPSDVSPVFAPGRRLAGKYRIERQLAEGGIGVVVVATHLSLEQSVAIKYLKPKALENPTLVERFVREGRLAAKIRSDHVVRVFDVASHPEAGPYMVMEYLQGIDLGVLVQEQGPLAYRTAVDYVMQACDALAEAHAIGIVHRDLKPDNLFLATRAGGSSIVKIIDFGISKELPKRTDAPRERQRTPSGELFGTPSYMSPEQLRSSANVDLRTDVWSLGVILFELLTGDFPFKGNGVPGVCASIVSDHPRSLKEHRPDVPAELETIIGRCLEKKPEDRYRNIAELAQDLAPYGAEGDALLLDHIKRVVREAGSSIRPPTPKPGSLNVAEMAAIVAGAGGIPDLGSANERVSTQPSLAEARRHDNERPSSPLGARLYGRRGLALAAAMALVTGAAIVLAVRGVGPSPISSPIAASTASAAPPLSINVPPPVSGSAPSAAPAAASADVPSVDKTPARRAQKTAPRLTDRSRFGERL
jgi:eukaryotic-like serine/threonine-protein kinase